MLLGDAPFANFMAWSDWLHATADATSGIALDRLAKLMAEWLQTRGSSRGAAEALLASDYAGQVPRRRVAGEINPTLPRRQARHLAK